MKLSKDFINNHKGGSYDDQYQNCFNALGLYNSMQFVLRLRYDIHLELEKFDVDVGKYNQFDSKAIQAYSTYFHETIHWWQHIGSITGFILSISHPSQAHINIEELKKYIVQTGKIKPIKKYNELNATTNNPTDEEFKTINVILNNFHDIEYFKNIIIKPELVRKHEKEDLFESVGHSYHIAYSSFCNLIASCFDKDYKFVPNSNHWLDEFVKLKNDKVDGYYYKSPIYIPPTGVYELFEGQARFGQLQYLHFSSGGGLDWDDFENSGLLSGVYYSSFELFLKLIEAERPSTINSPLVALYMLVIDIAINPTDGFPFDILSFDTFIESVDPGVRFFFLCNAIKNDYPEVKNTILNYTASEYFDVSEKLSRAILCRSPLSASQVVSKWASEQDEIISLMKEESEFKFSNENFPIRLMFSRFIKFQKDKLSTPEFFCWPGFHCAGNCTERNVKLFKEHQALFTDASDGEIYPRTFDDKDENNVIATFNDFYSWVSTYDLTRQWISDDGEFTYDFFWLTTKYSKDELEEWANNNFKQMYGTSSQDFTIL
ncbi:hypothetical protein C9I87_03970 [Photobacterium iliopiscarium]|uniref:hypothetical protein n=1 Tax=Photobacterium iliopiscarium TaxID=56192 RepID=UPI000D16254A|nr:hypothetical protein [Photobacterium iliopiscarium]PST96708.1 hypothetical protein C9I87_03970 [Photobacterium iliopiscarium]